MDSACVVVAKFMVKSWADKLIQCFINQTPFEITRHQIAIPYLPEAFQGFTIVQISDLHIDRWNAPIVEAAINNINNLHADLLVCTGDTIADGHHFLPDVTHFLKQLQARHGKLACLGNHDYSDGSGSFGVRKALQKAGFDVLINDSTVLTVGHQKIQLAGADDLILGQQCLQSTAKRILPESPVILLSHNPENFQAISNFKPSLVLSGHTHGGQIYAPVRLHQHLMGSPYIAGLYQQRTSQLYVNRGLGSAVFVEHWQGKRISIPTPRWLVPREISVFELVNPQSNTTPRIKSITTWSDPTSRSA